MTWTVLDPSDEVFRQALGSLLKILEKPSAGAGSRAQEWEEFFSTDLT